MIQMCNTCNGMRQFCPFSCDRRYYHVQRNGSIGVFIYHKNISELHFFEHWFQNLHFLGKLPKTHQYQKSLPCEYAWQTESETGVKSDFTFYYGPPIESANSAIMKALLKLTSLPKFLTLVVGTKVRISMRNQLAFPICVSMCVCFTWVSFRMSLSSSSPLRRVWKMDM